MRFFAWAVLMLIGFSSRSQAVEDTSGRFSFKAVSTVERFADNKTELLRISGTSIRDNYMRVLIATEKVNGLTSSLNSCEKYALLMKTNPTGKLVLGKATNTQSDGTLEITPGGTMNVMLYCALAP